jgi:hypothetical protein
MIPTKEYDFDPRNLPQELLAAIGLAVASASQTESIVAEAIGGCLGIDAEYALALTTHMTLPLKFSILRSVAEIRIDDLNDLDELDALLSNVDLALGKRHAIAHDGWCKDPDTGQLLRTKTVARMRLEAEFIPVTIAGVMADAEFIHRSGLALMTFIYARNLLPHLPAQPRPRGHKSKAARKKRRNK